MVPLLQRLTFEQRKSKQNALAPPLGTSLRLGVPTPALDRGPPRWAILGPARLTRRPAGLPTLQSLRSGTPSLGEVPSGGAKRFAYFCALQK